MASWPPPWEKPLISRLVAGDVFFRYTVGAHHAPLVVITGKYTIAQTAQPDFGQIIEPTILKNLLRIQMAMVVRKGKGLSVVVEQMLGGFGFQKEIFIHKRFQR